jgi:hypothetical protein
MLVIIYVFGYLLIFARRIIFIGESLKSQRAGKPVVAALHGEDVDE